MARGKQATWQLKGKPVKLGNAVLQRRADPLPIRDVIDQGNPDDRSLGGIVLNGQHSFLERMPQQSWFKIRKTAKGRREVYLVFRCRGLLPIEYGPFRNEERALWMLDRMLNDIQECLLNRDYDEGPWRKDERKLSHVLAVNMS
jgi:hypothetical protein